MAINWNGLEKFIGEDIPNCLKIILQLCGFNTVISLSTITEKIINDIESCVNKSHMEQIRAFTCCYSDYYVNQNEFKFLPGHEATLLALPNILQNYNDKVLHTISELLTGKYSFIMNELIKTAEQNMDKNPNAWTYPDSIRFWATYLFINSGRSCYEVLRASLPFPSVKTVFRCISNNKKPVVEGEVRSKELSDYLENMRTKKIVWISEDGTVIKANVTYDPSTNQLVGLVPPINQSTGCPQTLVFTATDAETIKRLLQRERSRTLYLVMAKPLDENIPPFVLQIFGTDNKLKKEDIIKRWKFTTAELNRHDITIAGWSSDGDPRLLSSMIHQIANDPGTDMTYIQDTSHIATKMRNRTLNESVSLSMGRYKVAVEHLKKIVNDVDKSVHGLNSTDICPKDRQNLKSFEKIIDQRVISALQKNVPNSEATVKYLKLCDDVTSSFLHFDLKPRERLLRMFRSVYFLRIWRKFIVSSQYHNLQNNFISSNAYYCIEINAKGLIELIKRYRTTPHLFLPTIFDSQTCEKTFRQVRSMGTMNFTRINFSIYDLLHMIGRIEALNDIAYVKLCDSVKFPVHDRLKKTKIYELPSDAEIEAILKEAKDIAIEDALDLGMIASDIDEYEFQSNLLDINDDDDEYEQINRALEEDENEINLEEELNEQNEILKPTHVNVIDENGKKRTIRKSTLVWILTEPGPHVSKDRLKRVQVGEKRKADD